MTAVALSSISQILERLYGRGITRIGMGKEAPLWSMIPKHSDFYEQTYTLRNRYGRQPSGSRLFATARSRAGASSFGSFQLTRNRDYLTIQFEGETLRATSNDSRRMVTYLKEETDAAFEKAARRMNHNCFRNYGGAIAQVASGGATQTITVTAATRGALIGITPGMYLVSSNTDGTSGAVDANATIVSAVNRTAGTITTTAASWDAITGFSDNDYIFADGDFGAAMYGLDSWVPSSDPGATSFFGQDRSLDPTYLGGIRYTASAGDPDGTIERSFINAAAEGVIHGARPDTVFMHPLDFAIFSNELAARIEYDTVKGRLGAMGDTEAEVDVGITGVRIMLASGPAMVVPDPDCQRNVAWMLDMRTWGFYGLGMTGYEFDTLDGGGKFLRMSQSDVDGVEANMLIYGQIGCSAPGCNIRVDLSAVLA